MTKTAFQISLNYTTSHQGFVGICFCHNSLKIDGINHQIVIL